jgi:hypothetical protein
MDFEILVVFALDSEPCGSVEGGEEVDIPIWNELIDPERIRSAIRGLRR